MQHGLLPTCTQRAAQDSAHSLGRFCLQEVLQIPQQTDRSSSSRSQLGQNGRTTSTGSPDGNKHLVFLSSMVQPQSRQCCAIFRESVSRRRRIDFSELVICHFLAPELIAACKSIVVAQAQQGTAKGVVKTSICCTTFGAFIQPGGHHLRKAFCGSHGNRGSRFSRLPGAAFHIFHSSTGRGCCPEQKCGHISGKCKSLPISAAWVGSHPPKCNRDNARLAPAYLSPRFITVRRWRRLLTHLGN